MKKILALLAATVLAVVAYAGQFPDISISEVKALVQSKQAVFLDANGTDSYIEGHIPTALDFEKTGKNLAAALPKDKNTLIVAYCGGPKCRAYEAAASAAKKLGYKNIKHMSAGIAGWTAAGQPVEKGQ
ncbi:MAG TPA: rhodanese-like domain-containing protein [Verrucomicrobiae bacterium]|nr:rhodanese-like domain-containing protein [Verrucomicrobiae bacterium]